jgi:glucosylceramidase
MKNGNFYKQINKAGMKLFLSLILSASIFNCTTENISVPPTLSPSVLAVNEIDFWLTKGDQSIKLEKQKSHLTFGNTFNSYANIEVFDAETFQTVEGFGYSLTGGSAQVIMQLSADKKAALLEDLFGQTASSISVSYLRISIGASDLDASVFSYNDLPAGETDLNLTKFSLSPDMAQLIPLLKEILLINPNIKIMGSPWSAPVWMKDNKNSKGGSLLPQYYASYAQYFVNYIQQMKDNGITIDAITPQNEPLHPGNNPSMYMTAFDQTNFIKNNLGPAFAAANIKTKIIIYDHNCDRPDYPISVLNDPAAKAFIAGSAFHLYGGDISALSTVRSAHPDKALYFTEQWTSSVGDYAFDLKWHSKNIIIGSMRNWSRVALEWNLASDASFGPHTPGGCTQCKGAITVSDRTSYTKNVAYYIIAHASKFVPAGSVRIGTAIAGNLSNVAFKTPAGKTVLIVVNDGSNGEVFNIKYNGKWATTSLDAGAVGTFIW